MTENHRFVGARVAGRVQGVGFRAWTRREALRLGLRGWVRNAPDGTVLALFAGPPALVAAMLTRLAEGPSAASVEAVETWEEDRVELPGDFQVLR